MDAEGGLFHSSGTRKVPKLPTVPKPAATKKKPGVLLRVLRWKDFKSVRARFKGTSRDMGHSAWGLGSGSRTDGDHAYKDTSEGSGDCVQARPDSAVPPRLEMTETVEGSMRKLEHLTGSKIVQAPRISTSQDFSSIDFPQNRQSLRGYGGNDMGSMRTSHFATEADTEMSRYPSTIGPVIHPLTARPVNTSLKYPHITEPAEVSRNLSTGPKAKRVSFTQGNDVTHHIAAQYNPTRRNRMSFPQQPKMQYQPLPSLPVAVPLIMYGGGYDEFNPPPLPQKDRHHQPPPRMVQSGGSFFDRGRRKSERQHRCSWNGRSVLELDDASTGSNETFDHLPTPPQPPPLPGKSLQYRKPVPVSKDLLSAYGPESTTSRNSQLHEEGVTRDVPRTYAVPYATTNPGLVLRSPSFSRFSITSAATTISSFGAPAEYRESSPVFDGLSPAPATIRTASSNIASEIAMSQESGYRLASRGHPSVADTVFTEDTGNSLGTNLTQRELEMEMKQIRERAKRASIYRKARRREEERGQLEKEEDRAKGKEKGKGRVVRKEVDNVS